MNIMVIIFRKNDCLFIIIITIMNREELIDKLYYSIYQAFESGNPAYSFTSIPNCYYESYDEIRKLGKGLLKRLALDQLSKDELDLMVTGDYFIFKFGDLYIIINHYCDLFDCIEYKLLIVKNREEALTHRYGQ